MLEKLKKLVAQTSLVLSEHQLQQLVAETGYTWFDS